MDFLLELLLGIVVEGSIELGSEKTVPMPLRVLAVVITLSVFFGTGGIVIYFAYNVLWESNKVVAILMFIVGAFLIYGGYVCIKEMLQRKNK